MIDLLAAELARADERSLVLVFGCTTLGAVLSRWHLRLVLPTVVVEIVLGILIGPEVLGIATVNEYIDFISDFGLALLFFFAGIEVIEHRVPTKVLRRGTLGWGMSLAIGMAVGVVLDRAGADVEWWLLAVAVSTTSLGTLVPILSDAAAAAHAARSGRPGHGCRRRVLAGHRHLGLPDRCLRRRDGVRPARPLRRAHRRRGEDRAAGAPTAVAAIAQDTLHTTGQVGVRASIFVLVLLVFLATDAGFEFVLGAFAAGVVVGLVLESPEGKVVRMRLEGIGYGFLIPVYFVVTGMNFDIDSLLTARGPGAGGAVPRRPSPHTGNVGAAVVARARTARDGEPRALRRDGAALSSSPSSESRRSAATSRKLSRRRSSAPGWSPSSSTRSSRHGWPRRPRPG